MRVAVILTIAAIAAELGSLGALHALGLWPEGTFEETYRTYVVEADSDVFKARRVRHPFFGPVNNKGYRRKANNYGFFSPVSYPYERKPGDFVIGVLGGSFATSFVVEATEEGLFAGLAERVPWLAGRRIVLLNLALGAGKQPQQYFIASYFTRMVDLLVNIDGYTEASNFTLEYPMEYPSLYHAVHGPGTPTDLERAAGELAEWLPSMMGRAALTFAPLRASSAYLLLWKSSLQAEMLLINAITRRMRARKETGPPYKHPFDPKNEKEVAAAVADVWERYSRLEHIVARTEGKQAIFFLQPSAYVSPGKPLTEEERKLGLDGRPTTSRRYSERFALIRERARKLVGEGVAVVDLSGIFASERRTVYKDRLCHLNATGNRILADRMMEEIAKVLSKRKPVP